MLQNVTCHQTLFLTFLLGNYRKKIYYCALNVITLNFYKKVFFIKYFLNLFEKNLIFKKHI